MPARGGGGRRAPAPAVYGVEARLHKSHWLSKNVPASGSWLGVAAEGLGVYGPTPADRSPGPAVTLLYTENKCTEAPPPALAPTETGQDRAKARTEGPARPPEPAGRERGGDG